MGIRDRHAVFGSWLEMCRRTSSYRYLNRKEKNIFGMFMLETFQKYSSYRYLSPKEKRIIFRGVYKMIQCCKQIAKKNLDLQAKEKNGLFRSLLRITPNCSSFFVGKSLTRKAKRLFLVAVIEMIKVTSKSYKGAYLNQHERRLVHSGILTVAYRFTSYDKNFLTYRERVKLFRSCLIMAKKTSNYSYNCLKIDYKFTILKAVHIMILRCSISYYEILTKNLNRINNRQHIDFIKSIPPTTNNSKKDSISAIRFELTPNQTSNCSNDMDTPLDPKHKINKTGSSFGAVNNVDLHIKVDNFKSSLESEVTESKTDNQNDNQKIYNSEAINERPSIKRDSNKDYNNQYEDSDDGFDKKVSNIKFEVENISMMK